MQILSMLFMKSIITQNQVFVGNIRVVHSKLSINGSSIDSLSSSNVLLNLNFFTFRISDDGEECSERFKVQIISNPCEKNQNEMIYSAQSKNEKLSIPDERLGDTRKIKFSEIEYKESSKEKDEEERNVTE